MSSLQNSVQLIGRPGMDPEIKKLGNSKLAKFSISTDDFYRNEKNELIKETSWHNVVAWNKQADMVERWVRKGKMIALEGKLKSRSYEDKEGVKRYITEIVANEFFLIEKQVSDDQNDA